MSAFSELGVCDEITEGLEEIGWNLPTDIQAEAVPLILGGGDVLMAAETGSGKTGAFCLPVIQIVQESKRNSFGHSAGTKSQRSGEQKCLLNANDRSDIVAISPDGKSIQTRDFRVWGGCRATFGAVKGSVYYEVECKDEGLSRFGFGTTDADLNLGTCPEGFGFGGTGKKSNRRQFDEYGESFGQHDIIGCALDRDKEEIHFYKNGKHLGLAFNIPNRFKDYPLYPLVCLKNAEVEVNFDGPFKYNTSQFKPVGSLRPGERAGGSTGGVKSDHYDNKSPMCIILEPSRELALQTEKCIEDFSKYVSSPGVSSVCLVGGENSRYQLQLLQEGVDIVVGTPGRIEDFINTQKLGLSNVRFLIVDECDALLAQNQTKLIESIHRKCPSFHPDGSRLQMVVCSATLHNFNVKKMANKLMSFPTWVDLKGEDSVPDTVHHCVVRINPKNHSEILTNSKNKIISDGVHKKDRIDFNFRNLNSEEENNTNSEAIKLIKFGLVIKIIEKHKMDQGIIFCRTTLDCDNLEKYFVHFGGGPRSNHDHSLSCICLHSRKKPQERKQNLQAFKDGSVRFLICTDVAARGIDVQGIPYVINVTMPDDKANYLHRIGRVGRAKRMGLAISLVGEFKEKVWYHSNCNNRGQGCYNTNDVSRGGCTIWYDELNLLGDVEEHLKDTIEEINPTTLDVPVNEFDGKVVYGEKNMQANKVLTGHYREMLPTLSMLKTLEKTAQSSFITLSQRQPGLIQYW